MHPGSLHTTWFIDVLSPWAHALYMHACMCVHVSAGGVSTASTIPATPGQLADLGLYTYTTPPAKIRRISSQPADSLSREKATKVEAMQPPRDVKSAPAGKGKGGTATTAPAIPVPYAPDARAQPHDDPGSASDDCLIVEVVNSTLNRDNPAPKRAAAKKSAPKPAVKQEVKPDGAQPAAGNGSAGVVKHEVAVGLPQTLPPSTPTSVRHERQVQTAMDENLRRASTAAQLETSPSIATPAESTLTGGLPAGTALAPHAQAANTGDTGHTATMKHDPISSRGATHVSRPAAPTTSEPEPAEPARVGNEVPARKKRREKTVQEKANHARFMRFSRSLTSTWTELNKSYFVAPLVALALRRFNNRICGQN